MNLKKIIPITMFLVGATAFSAMLKDGKYTSVSEYDKYGWQTKHTIFVKNGKITESVLVNTNKKSENKAEDLKYNEAMKKKSGISFNEAVDKLNKILVEKQSSDIDNVAGATHTVEDFKKSSAFLIKLAKEGKTGEHNIK